MGRPVRKGRKRKPRGGLARSYGAAVGLDRRVQFFRKIARFMRKGYALTVTSLFFAGTPAPINEPPAPAQLFCFSACLFGTVTVGGKGFLLVVPGRISRRAPPCPAESRPRTAAPLCAARRNVAGADPRDRHEKRTAKRRSSSVLVAEYEKM